jgi:hypothetical protein
MELEVTSIYSDTQDKSVTNQILGNESSISCDGSHKVERKMFVDDEVNTCSTRPTRSFPW